MLVRHPPSTNFDQDEQHLHPAKRLRRLDSTESLVSQDASDAEDDPARPARDRSREIPDSDGEDEGSDLDNDDDDGISTARTELESALPPVKTDKAAIEEYEATRAAEGFADSGAEDRLGQRKWVEGKSSIYVDAFNLALETVLQDEQHLFDETELAVFEHWRTLDYQAQYLYV